MNVSIYIAAWNDEVILPLSIAHYKDRFPESQIFIYDNFSTDKPAEVAMQLGCQVRQFYTGEKMDDQALINMKNNCWKGCKGWVIVVDADELLDLWPENLTDKFTVIDAEIIDMIGGIDSKSGVVYAHKPRKMACFNASKVQDINFGFGCHCAHPFGEVVINRDFKIYHFKWLSPEYIIQKNKEAGKRLSDRNKKLGLSFHYLFAEKKVRAHFKKLNQSINIQLVEQYVKRK